MSFGYLQVSQNLGKRDVPKYTKLKRQVFGGNLSLEGVYQSMMEMINHNVVEASLLHKKGVYIKRKTSHRFYDFESRKWLCWSFSASANFCF